MDLLFKIEEAIREDIDIKDEIFDNENIELNYSKIEFKNCNFKNCKIFGALESISFTDR